MAPSGTLDEASCTCKSGLVFSKLFVTVFVPRPHIFKLNPLYFRLLHELREAPVIQQLRTRNSWKSTARGDVRFRSQEWDCQGLEASILLKEIFFLLFSAFLSLSV